MSDHNEFEDAYSDSGFWKKLRRYALLAGREVDVTVNAFPGHLRVG